MSRIRINVTLTCVVGLASLITPAFAQRDRLSYSDRQFMFHAAQGSVGEVRLGRLAQDRATSDRVKEFGNRMAADHSRANDELKDLARDKGVALSRDTDFRHRQLYSRLSRLDGPAFDRTYMRAMLADHVDDVGKFRQMSRSARDPELRSWVRRTLPTLQEHLRMAQKINSRMIARQYRRMR